MERAPGSNHAAIGMTVLWRRPSRRASGWNRAATVRTGLGECQSEPVRDSNHAAIGTMGVSRRGSDRISRADRTPTGTATARCRTAPTLRLARVATGTAVAVCLIALCLIALCLIALCLIAPCLIAPCVTGLTLTWDRTPTETTGGAQPWTGTGSDPSAVVWSRGEGAAIKALATIAWTRSIACARRNATAGRGVPACRLSRLATLMARLEPTRAGRTDSACVPAIRAVAMKRQATMRTTRPRVRCPSSCPARPRCHGRDQSRHRAARSSRPRLATHRPGLPASRDRSSRRQRHSQRVFQRRRRPRRRPPSIRRPMLG